MANLRLGRVAAVHPEDQSLDLVMTDDGSRLVGVQVLADRASSRSGTAGLITPTTPVSGDKWDLRQRTDQDVIAVVGWFGSQPIVLGFLFPQISQMGFSDANRLVERHPSDVYTSIDDAGNTEIYHPSGTYLRIGTAAAHEDLTGKDVDGLWKIARNTGAAVHVQLTVKNAGTQKASLNIDPSGNITLTHSGNLTINTSGAAAINVTGNAAVVVGGTTSITSSGAATIAAPTVTINATTTTVTGALIVQGLLTYQAGMAGSGGGAVSAVITGNMTISGTVIGGGNIGLASHHHTAPNGDTGPAIT